MGILEDIQSALQNAWNWFGSIGASVQDALGSVGTWIYQGLVYLSNVLGQWISSGLSWIGSGLAWLGQQLYNFGQWLWNGLLWLGNTIVNAFRSIFEWIYGIAVGVFNTILSWAGGFVNFFNQWFTNLILGFRGKLKQLIMYNITMAGIDKTITSFFTEPSLKKLGGFILAPLAGAFVAEVLDKLIPTPSTQPLQIFPWFTTPSVSLTPIAIPEIAIPQPPSAGSWSQFGTSGIQPPSYAGYGTIQVSSGVGSICSLNVIGSEYAGLFIGAGNTVSTSTIEPFTVIEYSGLGNIVRITELLPIVATYYSRAGNTVSVAVLPQYTTLEYSGAGSTVDAYYLLVEGITGYSGIGNTAETALPLEKTYDVTIEISYTASISPYDVTLEKTIEIPYTASVSPYDVTLEKTIDIPYTASVSPYDVTLEKTIDIEYEVEVS